MGIRIVHSLHDLASDMAAAAATFRPAASRHVADVARDGNKAGKANARRSSGKHARKYAGTFTATRTGPLEYEWGPVARGQGNLAHILENGTRNNPPHHDIAKAADSHGAGDLARKIRGTFDEMFWP